MVATLTGCMLTNPVTSKSVSNTVRFTQIYTLSLWPSDWQNVPASTLVLSNMKKAKKLLKSELWVRGQKGSDSFAEFIFTTDANNNLTHSEYPALEWFFSSLSFFFLLSCFPDFYLDIAESTELILNKCQFIKTRWIVCLFANKSND